jgi:predicted transcriptional regulator
MAPASMTVSAGESVGRTVEQLQNDLRSLEISSQGSAMYETNCRRRTPQPEGRDHPRAGLRKGVDS